MWASRLGFAIALLAAAGSAHAVIFKFTADPAYNTGPPTGALTNAGWQLEGVWGAYLATPIAPTYFLAAAHVGGSVGDTFELNGFTYHTLSVTNIPGTDLNLWRVAETFPAYAALYTNATETGKHCVLFGRGTERGTAVVVAGVTNGWQWGAPTAIKRWGENDIAGIAGDFLRATFDRGANSNECHLSSGDSSGGLFIQESGEWKLAGINYGVDGPFSNAVDGTTFFAALVDRGGLCEADGSVCYTDTMTDNPSAFYSSRLSTHAGEIYSLLDFSPGIDLRVVGLVRAGNDVQIRFATSAGKTYRVDWRADLQTGCGWH